MIHWSLEVPHTTMKTIDVEIQFTEPVLAGSPSDPNVYAQFIASKLTTPPLVDVGIGIGVSTKSNILTEARLDEIAAIEALPDALKSETGFSIFPRAKDRMALDGLADGTPHFWDYHIRGFLKESAAAITGKALTAYKSKIDRWVFVGPRRLPFYRDGAVILSPESKCERIVRAMTMQGPRTTPKKSETMLPGASLRFTITVLPLGEREFTSEVLKSWFDYGQYCGFGEWRSGSNGRFTVTNWGGVKA